MMTIAFTATAAFAVGSFAQVPYGTGSGHSTTTTSRVIPPYPTTYPHGNSSTATFPPPPPPISYTSIVVPPPPFSTYGTSASQYFTITEATTVTESLCSASTSLPAGGPTIVTVTETTTIYPISTPTYTSLTIISTTTSLPPIIYPTGGMGGHHGNHTTLKWTAPPQPYSTIVLSQRSAPSVEVTYSPRGVRQSTPQHESPGSNVNGAGTAVASLSGAVAVVLVAVMIGAA